MSVAEIQNIKSQNRLHIADGLATAVVVLLPWSLSLTLVLILLWLVAVVLALGPAEIKRTATTAAGGLPIAMFVIAMIGMLWADVSWAERLGAADSYLKLLAIPLLLAHFRRSEHGSWPLIGFISSCSALLALSWIIVFWPQLEFEGAAGFGVPLKSSVTQAREFVICGLALLYLAIEKARVSDARTATAMCALALAFFANVAYVMVHHWFIVPIVTLPALAILLLLLVYRQFGVKAAFGLFLGGLLACIVIYATVPPASDPNTWSLLIGISRPVFWSKSLHFISEAPIFGHGTATIGALFTASAVGQTGVMAHVTTNPYQETLAIGIQFGVIGIAVLWAMWISHLWLFRGHQLADWIGLVVVVCAIMSSMFFSEIIDANQGLIYVIGVGIAGGLSLRANEGRTTRT